MSYLCSPSLCLCTRRSAGGRTRERQAGAAAETAGRRTPGTGRPRRDGSDTSQGPTASRWRSELQTTRERSHFSSGGKRAHRLCRIIPTDGSVEPRTVSRRGRAPRRRRERRGAFRKAWRRFGSSGLGAAETAAASSPSVLPPHPKLCVAFWINQQQLGSVAGSAR